MAQRWGLPVVAWPTRLRPSFWDLVALPLVIGLISLIAWASQQMSVPYSGGQEIEISLSPWKLPEYGLRTVMRMGIALVVSLIFSLVYAAAAAKSRRAEKLLIPILDILQSVPILGFLSITVTGFIALFPGSLLGYECAAIFAIFTSQAWNMTFSLYQSFLGVPQDLREAARMYHLSPWGSFWQLEVPYALPQLVWNMMMSMSGGWFFVVASEAITVNDQNTLLPGIGSYIALASKQGDIKAVGYAILAMLAFILIYDQLLFRPLLAWSQRFKIEEITEGEGERAWFLTMLQRAGLFQFLAWAGDTVADFLSRTAKAAHPWQPKPAKPPSPWAPWIDRTWGACLALGAAYALYRVVAYVGSEIGLKEVGHVFLLSIATFVRVSVLIALASLIWVPVGVWIGLRPPIAHRAQPIVQFLAAFPANLFFPIFVSAIRDYHLNVEVWLSVLMILGAQWYILFNVIAGTLALPTDYQYVASNLGVSRWLWWRKLILPGIFPAYVTGAITASGGAWNASIVSEVAQWGDDKFVATGVGAYIAEWTATGDFPRIVLGITMLSLFVLTFNRLFWRRLYTLAEERLRLD
ncbi:MAG TPA: ABC transporter permease subunit [Stellaceae bacterium]|jgi:NitT/TauT family transport system permease protein|nr:ABC transporter permease subunit [Stellaceae bacterium]